MDIYSKIVSCFDLKRGDCIWLSSELIKLVLLLKRNNITFDSNALIETFQKAVGPEGTILIPNFSFEFSNHKFYDIRKTKGVTGALGNIALNRDDFKRTKHPMHSFEVWGKDQDYLVTLDNRNSFGSDSPFAYCISHHVKQIILGTDYVHAMTFVHYAEVSCNVPYRFAKTFTGKYVHEDGSEEAYSCDYAARKLEIRPTECFNRMGAILEKAGTSKRIDTLGINSYLVDLAKSFPIICEDIISNQCKNIYEFNIPREEIFTY